MKRILVRLDGTKNAEAALSSLAQFCSPGDEVVLLKVEKPESPQRAGYRPSPAVMEAIADPASGVASLLPRMSPIRSRPVTRQLRGSLQRQRITLRPRCGSARQRSKGRDRGFDRGRPARRHC
jgi:hypothetical protein